METGKDSRQIFEEELFESVTVEGQFVPGESQVFDGGREIPWLDMHLAQSGQSYFKQHYTSILFAHGLYHGLFWGFKPISGVVITTGGFKGLERTAARVLSTLYHLVSWYETDIVGAYTPGTKEIANIRHTHDVIRRKCGRHLQSGVEFDGDLGEAEDEEEWADPFLLAIRKDLASLDVSTFNSLDLTYNPPVPMSQFTMVVMQLIFLYPAMVHPREFGIVDTQGGAEGFEHLWALIGHLSGIDDKYNVALHSPGKEFYVRFWKEVFLPNLLVRDKSIARIQECFYQRPTSFPQPSIAATHYFFLKQTKVNGFEGTELFKMMSWKDLAIISLFRILLALLTWSTLFRKLANRATRSSVKKILDKFAKEEEAAGRQFTTLPTDIDWSTKYRKRDPNVLRKWKKSEALLDLMHGRKKNVKNVFKLSK